ncbi:putative epidermal cell surface receptor isoform X2 [Ornithodoros turicata]|uniref:putative epidermal cell surface receptor isoform X2 n=1 Tax=Ornithodoros turicata TaxID=34597 RepID=UPI0031394053
MAGNRRLLISTALVVVFVLVPVSSLPTTGSAAAPSSPVSSLDENSSATKSDNEAGVSVLKCACGVDVSDCPAGRTAKTTKCPCGLMCARLTGEKCSSDEPCAKEFGLSCDPVGLICKGKIQIEKIEVTYNTASLRWKMRQYPTPIPGVFYTPRYVGSDTRWTNAEPNESSVTLKNLRPDTEYVVRIMQDGTQEMTLFRTKEAPAPAAAKVLVTSSSPSSLVLAWDDFKVPSYDAGYVLQYRLMTSQNDQSWETIQLDNTPLAILDHLKPQTAYQVKVSVWEDKETAKLGATSEVLTVFTTDGCVRFNQTYRVGEEFDEGCDLRCLCRGNDQGDCKPRCVEPYMKVGTMASDPLCYEKKLPDDPCCVSVRCAQGKTGDAEGKTYSEKPGNCPEIVEDQSTDPDSCSTECQSDFECSGTLKCCPSSCGGAVCVEAFSGKDACENVFCGTNAFCIMEKNTPVCRCLEGYSGDPNDVTSGCVQGPAVVSAKPDEVCLYNNQTYPINEVFYDGCNLKCHCTAQSEVECQQRCAFPADSSIPVEVDPMCELVGDPQDSCCNILVCDTSLNGTAMQNETSSQDGVEGVKGTSVRNNDVEVTTTVPVGNTTLVDDDMATTIVYRQETVTEKMLVDTGMTTIVNVLEGTESPLDNSAEEQSTNNVTVAGNNITDTGAPRIIGKPHRSDGCEFGGKVYGAGEQFFDGCESKCTCSGKGHLSCVPRCSLMNAAPGDTCKEVADPNDSCCKLLVCSPPGDTIAASGVEGLKLLLDSAEAENGTTVRIRWTMADADKTTHDSSDTMVQVWYAEARDGNGGIQWMKQKYKLSDMRTVHSSTYEMLLGNLRPETDYYLKVVRPPREDGDSESGTSSNTVKVRTFASVVKTSFKGCVHRNRTYEAGEVFYDGCDHKCVCHEEGLIECQDRCEVYIDTVGFEDCHWGPAPGEPCCMVPFCDGKPPVPRKSNETPRPQTCLDDSGKTHPVGDTWEYGQGCTRRVCTCVMLANGTATSECVGGCPPLSELLPVPSSECPQPIVVKPDDPCVCPYIMCNGARSAAVDAAPPMCKYDGRFYNVNEEFYNGCVEVCHCGSNLRVNCALIECPHHFNHHLSECLEWDIDPTHEPEPPNCCPPTKCKKDGACLFNGIKFRNFQLIPQHMVDCGKRCVCVNGNVSCENRCPPLNSSPPPTLPCHPSQAYRGHLPGDECCTHWMCREPEKPGKELQNVSVVAVNTTTIRVRFTLSQVLIGLVGHAELHYTTDATLPREFWSTQKFARPKRLFDTPNIEYYLSGLTPETTYFFQIRIIIDELQSGPESDVYKLLLPAEPTTTTTVPPLLLLDMMMAVNSIDPHTAKVSWRPLDAREKKYVDGLQVRYKLVGHDSMPWKTTPMIHRDRTSYLLQDLEPNASYLVDMQFTVPEGLPTHIESAHHVEMKTAHPPKDDFVFELIINLKKTEPFSASFVLEGIPEPIAKYVNVFKVMYKSDAAIEQSQNFMVLREPKLVLENLKPSQRYKVWVDAYLTNGKTTSSNVLEFHTKPGPVTTAPPTTTTTTESNEIEDSKAVAFHSTEDKRTTETYYIALIIVAILAVVACLAFAIALVMLLKRQSTAKAPITRNPSESAYDNPTYKTYDGEKPEEKNGNVQA